MTILAIDPGSAQSAVVIFDAADDRAGRPPVAKHEIVDNEELVRSLRALNPMIETVVIEWMSPRGMPTSAQEFETLYWVGRFTEAVQGAAFPGHLPTPVERITRLKVKMHVCGSAKANDTNIRAALIDRFGGVGGKDAAIGKKASPGPLYGVASDEWAALALAVTWADQHA
jgi:hypothetical protein